MYAERASRVPEATVWTTTAPTAGVRVLPDGCMDLIWREGELLVAGPDTHAHLVRPGDPARYAAVRLAPGTAGPLLGVDADALRDARVPLRALWPDGVARRLAERASDAPDPAAVLEDAVLERLADAGPPAAWRRRALEGARAGAPVADVATLLGWSERQLHRRSVTAFGYGLRTLTRVLRLGRALEAADRGLPLARVAALAGYADQAHLSRDVRALGGVTPRELVAERRRASDARSGPSARPAP